MDDRSLRPDVALGCSHVRPPLIVVTKAKFVPVSLKCFDNSKAGFEHEVADFSPQRTMIQLSEFVRRGNFWSLELRAQSSKIAVAVTLSDVVQRES